MTPQRDFKAEHRYDGLYFEYGLDQEQKTRFTSKPDPRDEQSIGKVEPLNGSSGRHSVPPLQSRRQERGTKKGEARTGEHTSCSEGPRANSN
jgi:hypothetical protein